MKIERLTFAVLAFASSTALADQYTCAVYCLGPYDSTKITVQAKDAKDAAAKVDVQSDTICQAAGHKRSTPMTMKPEQCVKGKV